MIWSNRRVPVLLANLLAIGCRPQVRADTGEESSSTGPAYGEPRVVDFCMDGEPKLEPDDDMMDPIASIVWPEPDTIVPIDATWKVEAQVYDDNCVATLTVFYEGQAFELNHGDMMAPTIIEPGKAPHTAMIGIEAVDASGRHSARVDQEVRVGQ